VQPGQCIPRRGHVRITRHLPERALELATQPGRRGGDGDVHREVDQTGLDFAVAVVPQVDQGHAAVPISSCRFQYTSAPTHVIAKIAAMP